MAPKPDPRSHSGDPSWKRFNDEIFSLRARTDAATDPLVSKLAAEGVELIVDARRRGSKIYDIEGECEEAGMYYVPALQNGSGLGLTADVATRYAKLAMRHKTCFVVDGDDDELLSLVSEQLPFAAVPLDDGADMARTGVVKRRVP